MNLSASTYPLRQSVCEKKEEQINPASIRLLRLSYGLDCDQFALLLGWKPSRLNAYENGRRIEKNDASLLLELQDPQKMLSFLLKKTAGN